MGFRDLDPAETEHVLARERVVRLAFHADGEHYLVPVFFTWHEGALCGFTTPGRKTEMAARQPRVAFQVDSTVTTGPWEWASVTGEGDFEMLDDPLEAMTFAPALQQKLADAPDWASQALEERFERLGRVPWRLRPRTMSGRAHGPED